LQFFENVGNPFGALQFHVAGGVAEMDFHIV